MAWITFRPSWSLIHFAAIGMKGTRAEKVAHTPFGADTEGHPTVHELERHVPVLEAAPDRHLPECLCNDAGKVQNRVASAVAGARMRPHPTVGYSPRGVPQHPYAVQLCAPCDRRRDPRRGTPVRTQGERDHPTLAGQRGAVCRRRGGDRRDHPAACRRPGHHRPSPRPRDRGRESTCSERTAVWTRGRVMGTVKLRK